MSDTPTIYAYRAALKETLRHLIVSKAVPAINADMIARGGDGAPQFSDTAVVVGDLMNIAQPTICVVDGGEDNREHASEGRYRLTMRTQIRIKSLYALSNSPEDYAFFFDSCTDNLRDLLTSTATRTLNPINPATGNSVLPGGQRFVDCLYRGARPINFPTRNADGMTRTRGTLLLHQADIEFTMNRPLALGG